MRLPDDLKVGDECLYGNGRSGGYVKRSTVKRLTTRTVELEDGTKWTRGGNKWGDGPPDPWHSTSVWRAVPGEWERIEARQRHTSLVERARSVAWGKLSADQLTRILAITKEPAP